MWSAAIVEVQPAGESGIAFCAVAVDRAVGPATEHLGNFPQAFSHLAAVEAAARIILADRLAEITRMTETYDVTVIGASREV